MAEIVEGKFDPAVYGMGEVAYEGTFAPLNGTELKMGPSAQSEQVVAPSPRVEHTGAGSAELTFEGIFGG